MRCRARFRCTQAVPALYRGLRRRGVVPAGKCDAARNAEGPFGVPHYRFRGIRSADSSARRSASTNCGPGLPGTASALELSLTVATTPEEFIADLAAAATPDVSVCSTESLQPECK